MKHIFYLHSNICIIAVYDYIFAKLRENERIVILTNRGCKFPKKDPKIKEYDLYSLFENKQRKLGSLKKFSTYRNLIYFRKYYKELKDFSNRVIDNEDFILYIPNYGVDIAQMLEKNKRCKGYFFIEEGGMSYLSMDFLQKKYNNSGTRLANLFRRYLLGINTNFQLTITSKYKGTVSLTKEAFPWNNISRIEAGTLLYNEDSKKSIVDCNNIIIISYAVLDYGYLYNALKLVIDHINKITGIEPKIAIKIHPQVYVYYKDYLNMIDDMLETSFKHNEIVNLPPSYSIESSIITSSPNIYSIHDFSSLSLYSILLSHKQTYLVSGTIDMLHLQEISTLKDFYKLQYNI